MERHHDHTSRGHPGVIPTTMAAQRYYSRPTLVKDVQRYVETCDLCQRMKGGTQRPAGLPQLAPLPPPEEKAKHWVIGCAVKLPRTSQGNDSILIMVTREGKYVLARACAHHHSTSEAIKRATTPWLRSGHPSHSLWIATAGSQARFRAWSTSVGRDLHTASVDHQERNVASRRFNSIYGSTSTLSKPTRMHSYTPICSPKRNDRRPL